MTAASDALTEAHRLAQLRVGGEAVEEAVELWDLLDLDDIDGSLARWLAALLRLTSAQNRRSADAAARYLVQHRRILAPTAGELVPVQASPLAPERVRTALLVSGPFRLRRALSTGKPFDRAVREARASSAGEVMRLALDGSRSLIDNAVGSDRAILGVQRRTAPSPCHFCAMLASRGPVYRSVETARFRAHASCACQPEPVYQDRAPLTPQALVEREKWDRAKQLGRDEGVRTEVMFRRIHEGRA